MFSYFLHPVQPLTGVPDCRSSTNVLNADPLRLSPGSLRERSANPIAGISHHH